MNKLMSKLNFERAFSSRRHQVFFTGAILATMLLVAATTGQEAPSTTQPVVQGADLVSGGLSADGRVRLMAGKSLVVNTRVPYKRVNVGNPDVADVNPIAPTDILLTAKTAGSTQLIVWDDNDRSQVIDVLVDIDLQALEEQFDTIFPGHGAKISNVNGSIALRGRAGTAEIAEQMVTVATPYGKVMNFLEVSGGRQVMLQVRFAEVSRLATTQLGVNFGYTDGTTIVGSNVGQVSPLGILNGDGIVDLGISNPSSAVTIFGRGSINGNPFAYFIAALRQNNLLRVLAEPNLVCISGQEAQFIAGGEYPVPVPQTGVSAGGIAIEYREFGVKLRFVPVVLGNGRIRMKVMPEVSDLDFSTAIRIGGVQVPGLRKRNLQTTVELSEGQTFALGGLLDDNMTAQRDVTPLLGDLPVLGALFRSVRYTRRETELVVLVTPVLVNAMNPEEVPNLPGEKWRHPTEMELFWDRDLGGEIVDEVPTTQAVTEGPAPMFRGAYGFQPATQPVATTGSEE
jgi:pilus assembly protein CpaC